MDKLAVECCHTIEKIQATKDAAWIEIQSVSK